LQTPEIYKPVSGWAEFTGSFTSGEVASTITGVWMTGTIKAAKMDGKWGVAPIPRLDGVEGAGNASNLGGSSWYVLSSAPSKDAAIDFLSTVWGSDVDFYQKILVDQGALGSLLAARDGEAYKATDPYFGGQAVWQNFTTWLSQIPGVNYGTFTNEADAAVNAQAPALQKGGSVDEAIAAIDAQIATQAQ
jgi:lactose/L-arabinose transport system substrate-binding protein